MLLAFKSLNCYILSMSDKNKKVMSLEDYTNMMASDMTSEIFKFISYYEKKVGKAHSASLVQAFLQNFVTKLVGDALDAYPHGSDEERYDKTMTEFGVVKSVIQDAVAFGFSDATALFSGKELDYYCSITPVPDPTSKLLN